jgi:hypothetical protein
MRKVWPKYRNIERMIRTYENILLKGLVSWKFAMLLLIPLES